MRLSDFLRPRRVWVNAPSTLQPDHKLHGKVGIGVLVNQPYVHNGRRWTEEEVHVYFY